MGAVLKQSVASLLATGLFLAIATAPVSAENDRAVVVGIRSTIPASGGPSTYLAGYEANRVKGITTASTYEMRVPALDCHGSDRQGIAVGVGDEDVAGSPEHLGVVVARCDGDYAFYVAVAYNRLGGDFHAFPVGLNDVVTIDVVVTCVSVESCYVRTTVAGPRQSVTAVGPGGPRDVTFGAFPLFADAVQLPVPAFDDIDFMRTKVDGELLDKAVRYDRVIGEVLQIKTTKLDRGAFRLKFKHH